MFIVFVSEVITQAKAQPLLEHQVLATIVMLVLVLNTTIVKARISIELGRQVLIDGEVERIFPFNQCHVKVGEPVEAARPSDILHDLNL